MESKEDNGRGKYWFEELRRRLDPILDPYSEAMFDEMGYLYEKCGIPRRNMK